MSVLRRFLYLLAILWAASGVAIAAAPGVVVEGLFGQPGPAEDAWIRMTGILAFGLALFAVLVAQRANEVWWWSWGLVIPAVAIAAVATLNALGGRPNNTSPTLWWVVAGVNAVLAVGLMWGLGRTAQERPLTCGRTTPCGREWRRRLLADGASKPPLLY